MKNTTIFYENSFGIMTKWDAEVLNLTDDYIDLKFSKNKAFRYKLNNTDFVLVTKEKLKDTNFWDVDNMLSFNKNVRKEILKNVKKENIEFLHNPKG